MNFVAPYFLIGSALSLLYGLLLLVGAIRSRSARKRFGEEKRGDALVTHDASKRRAWKGILLILATALAFFAAARPQYGKGQRLIPHANVDVVIALDYSKSMYARDVEPSRIARAKQEVQGLIKKLRGARFGAVAFAGTALSFPLTADGSSISSFLRHLEPNDMTVGGTAIAKALEASRKILRDDPKFKEHKRVIVLITDGEDLEGSPLAVAHSIADEKTVIHVVQIGSGSPEPIPEIGEKGEVIGWRQTEDHKPLTTELSPRAEKTLKEIATSTEGGKYIKAGKGSTGIDQIADELQEQMKTEYNEKVDTVYADVFMYPLLLALALLIAEALITDAPARRFLRKVPPPREMSPALRAALGLVASAPAVESALKQPGVEQPGSGPGSLRAMMAAQAQAQATAAQGQAAAPPAAAVPPTQPSGEGAPRV